MSYLPSVIERESYGQRERDKFIKGKERKEEEERESDERKVKMKKIGDRKDKKILKE